MKRKRFSPRTYASIIERQERICACGCGEDLGEDPREIQFDHEVPLEHEGPDTPDNLRALKRKHHLHKTIREAKARAKVKRIQERDGLRKLRMNRRDKALAKLLEQKP